MEHDAIAVMDFGRWHAHLIATKVRRPGVLAEIRRPEDLIKRFARETLIEAAFTITAEAEGINRCIWNLGCAAAW